MILPAGRRASGEADNSGDAEFARNNGGVGKKAATLDEETGS